MNRKHRFFYTLLRPLVIVFLWCSFGYRFRKVKKLQGNYMVISNHVTDFDPLFVAASFPKQMYFVGSEHIARWGWISSLLKYAFDPIMRPKGTSAIVTVMEMCRRLKKGGNVCLFAEGVRSWDGVTSAFLPSTAKVIQSAGCGLVTYKITGGYFASPMWSGASIRRGPVRGEPVRVYSAEELRSMRPEEITEAIARDIHEDAYARQLEAPKKYRGKRLAEGLENLLYICPECGARDSLRSSGYEVKCEKCGLKFRYDEYGMLSGIPFKTVQQASDWQCEKLREDVELGTLYTAEDTKLSAIANHEAKELERGRLEMNRESLRCGSFSAPMDKISDMAMCGQRILVFTVGRDYYELRPGEGFNALKFMLYYQEYKKIK